jgi:uncharacterized protein
MSAPASSALRERLARLGGAPRPRVEPPPLALPRGFETLPTPFGDALIREDVLALPALDPHPGSIAYLDTETTGLSGGTGTYVFAAAVARPIDSGLRLAQYFLPQPGMEPAFLFALHSEIAEAVGLASFNGASFDLPVLRNRWVMARMDGELSLPPHVDLLTLVRALFRHRMESCTLRTVEERLLGYEREDPVSGALAPDAYFEYLRRGSGRVLDLVLEHNRLDVISLVHLHSLLMRRLRGDDGAMDAADWLALGRHRFRRGARADGWRALRNAAGLGDGEAAATAGLWISKRLVRRRSIDAADRLLEDMESKFGEDLRVAVARARLLEWRRRDPHRALSVVEAAQERLPAAAPELDARRERLRRKVLRRSVENGRRQRDRGQRWLQARLGYDSGQDLEGGGVEL